MTGTIETMDKGKALFDAADLTGLTPLMGAAIGGHAATARLLLEHYARPNAATVDGMTALMYASMFRHRAACITLIAAGASVVARDRDGVSAADRARQHGDLEMVALLYRATPRIASLAA